MTGITESARPDSNRLFLRHKEARYHIRYGQFLLHVEASPEGARGMREGVQHVLRSRTAVSLLRRRYRFVYGTLCLD